jgi:glycosyltransferase involved in cell wall biosynthesis
MQTPPKISIVTPSFNQGHFIEHTLKSVLDQNYPNLEYIVIDGKSTDNSIEIIKKYSDRLSYWVSEKDNGHGNAINKGFQSSTGEIMAWINSDDMYFPWTLRVVSEVFTLFPHVNWIVGLNSFIKNSSIFRVEKIYKNKYDFMLGDYKWIQQESVFWRRSLWEKAGGKLNEDYSLMIDGELWCRFFLFDKLYHLDTILAGYRAHDTNRAGTFYKECLVEMDRAIDILKQDCDKQVVRNLWKLKVMSALNIKANYRSKKKSRSYVVSPMNVLSKPFCPKLLDAAAYPVLTPDRYGNWKESSVPFLLG